MGPCTQPSFLGTRTDKALLSEVKHTNSYSLGGRPLRSQRLIPRHRSQLVRVFGIIAHQLLGFAN